MFRNIKPGDRVRVADNTPYEPLASMLRIRDDGEGFIVETVHGEQGRAWQGPLWGSENAHTAYTIQIRYSDGSLSGAVYAAIFEKIVTTVP